MPAFAHPVELVLKNTTERISVRVTDDAGTPIDATALHLRIYDAGENLVVEDDIQTGVTTPSPPSSTRIVHAGTGDYYYNYGQYQGEAVCSGKLYFNWTVTGTAGTAPVNLVQVTRVVSLTTMGLLPDFRNYIDKALLNVEDDPLEPCFLGYTDSMLIGYLEGGLALINAYQPYPVWMSLDQFPSQVHGIILYDAGLLVGLTSQELYAVANDVINYNDNGNSFTIQHQPQLAAMCQRLASRLDRMVPDLKKQYVRTGSLRIELGPNFRLAALMAAAPSGSLFRNLFFVP